MCEYNLCILCWHQKNPNHGWGLNFPLFCFPIPVGSDIKVRARYPFTYLSIGSVLNNIPVGLNKHKLLISDIIVMYEDGLPTNRYDGSTFTNGAQLLTNDDQPTNATVMPTYRAELPTHGADLLTNVADLPTNGDDLPTNEADLPTNGAGAELPKIEFEKSKHEAEVPTNGVRVPTNGAEVTPIEAKLPTNGAQLPTGILVAMFQYMDINDLWTSTGVCKEWCSVVDKNVLLWKSRIRRHCVKNISHRDLLTTPMYKNLITADKLRLFLRQLTRLEDNKSKQICTVRTIDCMAASYKGMKSMKKSELPFKRNQNYKGVFDMILEDRRLVASVYDKIHIWNIDTYQITNMFDPDRLDRPKVIVTCFALLENCMVLGTSKGLVRLVDLASNRIIFTTQKNSHYISDVCVKERVVATVDLYGNVTVWLYATDPHPHLVDKPTGFLTNVTRDGDFPIPDQYPQVASKKQHRIIDFTVGRIPTSVAMNSMISNCSFHTYFLATTYDNYLTIYQQGRLWNCFETNSTIFCLTLCDNWIALGIQGFSYAEGFNEPFTIWPVATLARLDQWPLIPLIHFHTGNTDPISSIFMDLEILILGSFTGDLHRIDIKDVEKSTINTDIVIIRLHDVIEKKKFGIQYLGCLKKDSDAVVWTVKADCYRVFCGDETGKIRIHDFLMFEDEVRKSLPELR